MYCCEPHTVRTRRLPQWIAMWSSVLVMPVLAIVAKELFGGVNYGGAPSVDDFAFPPPSPE